MGTLFRRMSSGVAGIWCRRMHPAPMWPINNHYVCPRCQREWPVRWQVQHRETPQPMTIEPQRVRQLHPADQRIEAHG